MTAFRAALMTAAALTILSAPAGADESAERPQMRVDYDQATVVRLDRPAKTVVVGNAAIADALLVNDRTVYVQGRMFGNTNIVAIDGEGNEVINTLVTVGAPMSQQVTLYRGPSGQQNLACSVHCERTVTQGDLAMQGMAQDADRKVEISSKAAELSSQRK
ncbi:MAG: pilus assembly protein N-terminal domain-containing protein [Alphaproteobacteria bacterium]|nr:pilus assembly protein N-terminal domain-containing protein [Alphaproteobacteria bacterium]